MSAHAIDSSGQERLTRRTLLTVSAAVWLTFGFVQCAQSFVFAKAAGRAWSLTNSLTAAMPWWATWFALTPIIAWLVGRFSFVSPFRWRPLGVHAISCIASCSVQLTTAGAIHWLTTGQFLGVAASMPNQIQRFFGSFFLESVVTYAGATGVLMAIDFARAARDERVARARLEARSAALEASATKAKLDALAMELNPHFLFNTLSAISGLIAQDRRNEARDVVRRLGDLLRSTLEHSNGQYSSVTREVELLEGYLFIQRVRFSDRLSVVLRVDDGARDCPIPSMLLQPFVENAIRHGVEPKEGRGDVSIDIDHNGATLRVVIADSGPGFPFGQDGRLAHEGIGISNTRARLAHLYGKDATLVLRNRPAGGAEAVITILDEKTRRREDEKTR